MKNKRKGKKNQTKYIKNKNKQRNLLMLTAKKKETKRKKNISKHISQVSSQVKQNIFMLPRTTFNAPLLGCT